MNQLAAKCDLVCCKQLEEEPQNQQPVYPSVGSTKSSLLLPLPIASCSDHGHREEQMLEKMGATPQSNGRKVVEEKGGNFPSRSRSHWWGECQPHVILLREALLSSAPDIAVLGPLHGCFSFYMTHLHNEVLSSSYARTMTVGANVTRLESSFMWVGGWRPTSALVLVYSLMGIEIENALQTVRDGRDIGKTSTASLLSTRQLSVLHTLQKQTQHAEMKISKKLTVFQMLLSDQDMLEAVLLDAASPVANDSSRFNRVTQKRMSRFRRLLIQAEELRLHTLKDLLSLLTPIQAARCGVAVFEICASLRNVGSIFPVTLPNYTVLPVAIALPVPSDLVHTPSAPASVEILISDMSSSRKSINSADTLVSQSDDSVHLVPSCSSSSDDSALLVPSCSSSSSFLRQRSSSRGSDRVEIPRSFSSALPLENLELDATDGYLSADAQHPGLVQSEPKILSNRLLILSPASSDVIIQDCDLESTELQPYFEMPAQLSFAGEHHIKEETSDVQPKLGEGRDTGKVQLPVEGPFHLSDHNSNRISATSYGPGMWSKAQAGICLQRQNFARWFATWMNTLWKRKSYLEVA